MESGKVKFFKQDKGFGFIKKSDGTEIFVHVSGCTEKITENDEVEFDVEEGKKGPNAVNVCKARVTA